MVLHMKLLVFMRFVITQRRKIFTTQLRYSMSSFETSLLWSIKRSRIQHHRMFSDKQDHLARHCYYSCRLYIYNWRRGFVFTPNADASIYLAIDRFSIRESKWLQLLCINSSPTNVMAEFRCASHSTSTTIITTRIIHLKSKWSSE